MTTDHDLQRFVEAQQPLYTRALEEIGRGRKRSHWMWFIFPQIAGLGQSAQSRRYAIRTLGEAGAYLAHPLLGARYSECVTALQDLSESDPVSVLGEIDARKLRSSLTLFEAAGGGALIGAAIDRWFGGQRDERTLLLLSPPEVRGLQDR
jgi:uncharacterized protein (DUF1810 family)